MTEILVAQTCRNVGPSSPTRPYGNAPFRQRPTDRRHVRMVIVDRCANSADFSEPLDGRGGATVCQLCEELGYRWAVCVACGIEFPYQAADQLAAPTGTSPETDRSDRPGQQVDREPGAIIVAR